MNSVFEVFQATTERYPEASFLCVPARAERDYYPEGAEFSYHWMAEHALEAARCYAEAGYGPGHRIALLLENRPAFFVHYLALNSLGVSIVPVNPDYRHDEIVYQLEHADAVLVVGISTRLADLEKASRESPLQPPVIDQSTLPGQDPPRALTARRSSATAPGRDTECAMLYTSGTTGRPKGCILTNDYFLTGGEWYLALGGQLTMEPGHERVLNPLPLYHMNCQGVSATGMLLTGGCQILPDRFHPRSWWRQVCETEATLVHYLGVVPPMLLNQPPNDLERAHSVRVGFGAGVEPGLHVLFEERFGFPLVEVWGMTEMVRVLADNHEPRQRGSHAMGRPQVGLEVRVVDDNDQEVPPDTVGEMTLRYSEETPRFGAFSGYLKDDPATEEAWRGGWLHTGDSVRQAADGMLYFVDRKKNIIRRSGENIAAAEVEATLQAHDGVAQVAVLATPDETREEEVFACVVAVNESDRTETFARELFDLCFERLAYFKAPGWLTFVDDLPKTGSQKIQKHRIFGADGDPRDAAGVFDFRKLKRRR